jgi:outer membrane protein assembly factor BamB
VAGTEDGVVLALAAETGSLAWRTELSSEVLSSPRVAGGPVVARTLDGRLFGLDADSGEVRWSYDGGAPSLSVRGTSSPVIVSGVAIAGFDNGRIAAVRSATGEVLWEGVVSDPRGRSELERLADIDTDPVVEGGVVYAASYERAVAAFDAETGRSLWRRAIASQSGLAADGDLLYVADTDGSVQALDRISGAGVWTQGSLAGRGPAWPVVHGPFVALTDREGYVHWLRREDGRPAARTRSGAGRIAGPPARHGDALITYWGGGRLTAFRVR